MLSSLGASVTEVRLPGDLAGLEGLVIPGGESTTIGLLMETRRLMTPLREFVKEHPVFGTCAGLIMLAGRLTDGRQPLLGVMDITVRRNAFGRQLRSFEAPVELCLDPAAPGARATTTAAGAAPRAGHGAAPVAEASVALAAAASAAAPALFHGIFIRAPWVEETGPGVDVIARCDGHIVGVRQGRMIGVAFHPELGTDTRLHEHFLELAR
jgi:5'-phosphate synthase pdxT subunit